MDVYKKPLNLFFLAVSTVFLTLFMSACSVNNTGYSGEDDQALPSSESEQFTLQILGINDFHGQIPTVSEKGGMVPLAQHLLHAISATPEQSFILHAGDHVGASPAESALLQDEPAIDFLNILGDYCANLKSNPCHIIGAAGNHEFDEGSEEMLRLLNGGNHYKGPFIHPEWEGANYLTLGANVIDVETQTVLLPPYVVHEVNNVPIGFIGITLDVTPRVVIPGIVDNLEFMDQAEVVNKYAKELQEQGVEAIVVIVHDGSSDDYYSGNTSPVGKIDMESRFGVFLTKLPDAVDVLVTGHSHRFTNAYAENNNGKRMLVTQAFSSGRAYSDISVTIDPQSKDIVDATASVILTDSPNTLPLNDDASQALAKIDMLRENATNYAISLTQRVIGVYSTENDTIPLGQFIADSHQHAVKTDLAIMNPGGVRASLESGEVTWGEIFAVQPFGNSIIVRKYTGAQLKSIINDRNYWSSSVTISDNGDILINGELVENDKSYTVGGNNFILNSDRFNVGLQVEIAGLDIDATVDYIRSLPQPFSLQ